MNGYSIRQNEQNGQLEFWNGRFQAAAPQTSLPHQIARDIATKAPRLTKQAWRGADLVAAGSVEMAIPHWCGDGETYRCIATVASSSGNGRYRICDIYDELHQVSGQSCDCKGYLHGSAPRKGFGASADTPMCVHLMAVVIARRQRAIEEGRASLMTGDSLRQNRQGDLSPAAERAFIAAGITPIRPLTNAQKTAVAERKAAWRQQWDATVARQEAARRQPDAIGPALANVRRTDGRIVSHQQWEDAKISVVTGDPEAVAAFLELTNS